MMSHAHVLQMDTPSVGSIILCDRLFAFVNDTDGEACIVSV
jgi:hypothetical protein